MAKNLRVSDMSKYKWWFKVFFVLFSFMSINVISFAFTGLNLIRASSEQQVWAQVFVFIASGLGMLIGVIGDEHLKKK